MKILVGYDGSEYGDIAIEELRRAGLPKKLEAVVLTVADVIVPANLDASEPWLYPPILAAAETAAHRIEEWVAQAKEVAERGKAKLAAIFPDWTITAEASADSAADGVLKRAESLQPGLIVVGSHGRGAWQRLFLGSVSQKIVTHSNFPVRLARRATKKSGALRILVATDGSPGSEKALRRLAEGNWPTETQVRIATVADERVANLIPHAETSLVEWARHQAEKGARLLEKSGLEISIAVLSGDPRKLLLQEAEDWAADVVFLGGRGPRNARGYLMGSVSTALVNHAHCSVEVAY